MHDHKHDHKHDDQGHGDDHGHHGHDHRHEHAGGGVERAQEVKGPAPVSSCCTGGGCSSAAASGAGAASRGAAEGGVLLRLSVEGLCCDSEVALVKQTLGRVAGVGAVSVDVISKRVAVRHDPGQATAAQIAAALSKAGLAASPIEGVGAPVAAAPKGPPVQLWLTGGLLLASLGAAWWAPLEWSALGAVGVGVWPILKRAVAALRLKMLDINALMIVAIIGAVGIGEWIEGAAVVFLFALSAWLEDRALSRARDALGAVAALVPSVARRVGQEQRVPTEQVAVGEVLEIRPGEQIPLDGVVVKGRSSVDESALTGESMPAARGLGDTVSAGTINLGGWLEVKTTAASGDTAVARMARLVEQAREARSPSERFVDRFARVYTPLVMLGALLVAVVPPALFGAGWGEWFYRALVLLVVACPCSLVLSTPVAIVSALARAARVGVLIKGGVHLETLGRLKAVAFDKTGTLTRGRFEVTDCLPMGGFERHAVHALIARAERGSSHPLAAALLEHAGVAGAGGDVLLHETIEGEGIEVIDGDRLIQVGNHRMAERLGWHSPEEHAFYEAWRDRGRTVVYVGVDGQLAGLHALADSPRPEAAEALGALSRMGLRLTMLTGDNAGVAESVRAQVGLDGAVASELLPWDKVQAVEALKAAGGPVAMVGDGINDAPALARADLGVAMGVRGSAAALESADVALLTDDLRRLPEIIALGRRALQVIRHNIIFSLGIKALVLSLAAAGAASLWMAVAADVGSTLAVVLYSLTLLREAPGLTTPPHPAHSTEPVVVNAQNA